jgi:hypothetical protein
MRTSRTQKRARRRDGVVLTEALIAIGMLTVLLGGLSFFHSMYSAKTDTMQRARLQAWAGTRLECKGTEVKGEAKLVVNVSSPILANAEGPPQRTLKSTASISCNVKPSQDEDVVAVLGWAFTEGGQSLGSAFANVGSQMLGAFADMANPLNWF